MNPRVLRRFVIIAGIATFVMFSVWMVVRGFLDRQPGDYYTRQGDNRLGEGKYDEAMESFKQALREMPNHRGALMGRALVYIRTNRDSEAVSELTHLIEYLEKALESDDATGRGTLAAAYANRGIVNDRAGNYEKALADYVRALQTDEGALSGPSLFDKIIYGTPKPSTVRDRAIYLKQQLALPEGKRLLRVPDIDKKQRMYKP
jgi:tetratricopeptide (TPR) repeat protein